MSQQPFNSDGGFSTTGNVTSGNVTTGGIANLYSVRMSQSITWPDYSGSSIYEDGGLVIDGPGGLYAHGNIAARFEFNDGAGNTAGLYSDSGNSLVYSVGNVIVRSNNQSQTDWTFGTDGNLTLPTTANINYSNGNSILNQIYNGQSSVSIPDANGNVYVTTLGAITTQSWTFQGSGNLILPGVGVITTPPGSNANITLDPDGSGGVVLFGNTAQLLTLSGSSANSQNRMLIQTFGNGLGNRGGGTYVGAYLRPGAPVETNDRLLSLAGRGSSNGIDYNTNPSGYINISVYDDWTANSTPTRISFFNTDIGNTNAVENMRISPNGNVEIFNGNIISQGAYITGNTATGVDAIYAGVPGYTQLGSNVIAQFAANVDSYAQINFQNISTGNAAATEIIITADNGTDTTYFGDFGIAGSNYIPSPNDLGTAVYPNDTYVYSQGSGTGLSGNLVLGSNETNGVVRIFANGSNIENVVATFSSAGISVVGNITGGNLVTAGSGGDITMTGGNITGANVVTANTFIGNGSQLTDVAASIPGQTILPTIQTITAIPMLTGYLSGGEGGVTVTVANTIPVTEYGVIVTAGTTSQKYATGALGSIPGTGNITFTTGTSSAPFTVYAYVTSNAGTYYSNAVTGTSGLCLLAGTQIALSDGTYKAIEDITYTDKMLSWDFDLGCYAETTALWIKHSETGSQYNLLTFSDGTTLRTFDQHRIFNKQAGAFTYPMTDATPIGTATVNEHGQEITLVNKQIIVDTIEYYNVITDHHMNLFSNSILTSCRFNNIYPITDMKFVKDNRALRSRTEFAQVEDKFFHGLRLAEQTTDVETVEWYVNRLLATEVSAEAELAV